MANTVDDQTLATSIAEGNFFYIIEAGEGSDWKTTLTLLRTEILASSVVNGDMLVTPNGTGDLILDGLKWPQADGTNGQYVKTDGAGQLDPGVSSGVRTGGAQAAESFA